MSKDSNLEQLVQQLVQSQQRSVQSQQKMTESLQVMVTAQTEKSANTKPHISVLEAAKLVRPSDGTVNFSEYSSKEDKKSNSNKI